jgi:hypothetical protein
MMKKITTRRAFMLVKQVWPETGRPYRVLEHFLTSDGFRTRITNGTYASEAEAMEDIKLKEARYEQES